MVLMSNITMKKNNVQNLHCLEIQRSHGSLRNNDCINQILYKLCQDYYTADCL